VQIGKGEGLSSGYLLQHGDVINIVPYWSFTFCDKRAEKRHALTEIQQAECKVPPESPRSSDEWVWI